MLSVFNYDGLRSSQLSLSLCSFLVWVVCVANEQLGKATKSKHAHLHYLLGGLTQ